MIHAKTVSKQSILTQREELQRVVDARGLGNSQAVFMACPNDVFFLNFEINDTPKSDYDNAL